MPIVGLIGDGQTSLAARLVAAFFQLHGWQTALACRDGLFLGRRQLMYGSIFEQATCSIKPHCKPRCWKSLRTS